MKVRRLTRCGEQPGLQDWSAICTVGPPASLSESGPEERREGPIPMPYPDPSPAGLEITGQTRPSGSRTTVYVPAVRRWRLVESRVAVHAGPAHVRTGMRGRGARPRGTAQAFSEGDVILARALR
jgi:hypothetical protein